MFDSIKAISDVQKIKNGRKAKLSKSQIVNLIINLQDAKKNLSAEDFKSVFEKFKQYRKETTKTEMGISDYLDTCFDLIDSFETIAPFELYNGGDSSMIRKESPEKKQKRKTLKQINDIIALEEKTLVNAIRDLGSHSQEEFEDLYRKGRITKEQCIGFKDNIYLLQKCISIYPESIRSNKEYRNKLKQEIENMD